MKTLKFNLDLYTEPSKFASDNYKHKTDHWICILPIKVRPFLRRPCKLSLARYVNENFWPIVRFPLLPLLTSTRLDHGQVEPVSAKLTSCHGDFPSVSNVIVS